ncbi:MAG: 50S ribosomal protein L32 [Candidatus Dojkabacteria bacterium]|jgi:large subunit ribosomal protein L32
MGALPKRKISKGRKNRRRAHNAIKITGASKCPKCGNVKRSHFECSYCGYYNKQEK